MTDTDQKELQTLVQNYTSAIETGTPALESLFAKSNASLISMASLFDGKENVQKDLLDSQIRGAYKSIAMMPEDLDVRILNENTALFCFPIIQNASALTILSHTALQGWKPRWQ